MSGIAIDLLTHASRLPINIISKDVVLQEAAYALCAVVAGFAVGVGNYITEDLGFRLCQWLAEKGQMRRLAPGTKRLFVEHPLSNIWAVGAPYVLLYYVVFKYLMEGLVERAYISLNPLDIWPFIWCAMVCHDAWFFAVHQTFHTVKPLFKRVHARHHEIGSAITALGTAFGDAADIGLCFVAFHLVLGAYLAFLQPRWNVAGVVLLIIFEVGTNVLGHTGYEAPLWLHGIVTAGVGLTPLAATSKAHFLHHVDPRYNRSLYFTWWDRLAGTHRASHPLIFEGAK